MGNNFNSRPCERGFARAIHKAGYATISIHAPARGASPPKVSNPVDIYFNSRPCERGFGTTKGTFVLKKISIHAPARGASLSLLLTNFVIQISIHAPARGASRSRGQKHNRKKIFQFTPLREGLPRRMIDVGFAGVISIHAPARGASHRGFLFPPRYVFQFTPLREGLREEAKSIQRIRYFNSRPCERGFPCKPRCGRRLSISIHAPARGASAKINNFSFCLLLFFIH